MIRRVVTAGLLLPVTVAGVLYLQPAWFLLFISIFLVLALFEISHLMARFGVQTYRLTLPMVLLIPWISLHSMRFVLLYCLAAFLWLMAWSTFFPSPVKARFFSLAGNLTAVVYLGIPFSLAALLQQRNPLELLLVLSVIWISDIIALLVGKNWGKRKIFPELSPNKTLEGYAGGLLSSGLAALAYGHWLLPGWSAVALLVAGTLLGCAGALGDLFESMLKRGADVKDTSSLLPGHGGVLDRIDSLLFALPAYYGLSILIE